MRILEYMKTTEIEGEKYVWVSDLAEAKEVTRIGVIRAIEKGRLSAIRHYGRVFVPLAEAEAYRPSYGGPRQGAGRPKKTAGEE